MRNSESPMDGRLRNRESVTEAEWRIVYIRLMNTQLDQKDGR